MVYIFDTLSEKIKPLPKKINLFVCGPTVYDYVHIGHARLYLVFDMLVRYLRFKKFKVFYLQNITDIDDKIIDKVKSKKNKFTRKDILKLAHFYEKKYLEDMQKININTVDAYARASEHIKEIISQIKKLIELGYAYQTMRGIYFEVKKFKNYGKLSKQNLDELRPGWRIEPDPQKKDPLDFSLWKFWKLGWKSPWGIGRPGWHIEDTAIAYKFFGPQYDLHGGGMDLKFPHHESEIAQMEAFSSKRPMVKVWMHVGLLKINGKKMSKSLGNYLTLRDFLKPDVKKRVNLLRLMVASYHYRSPLNYTEKLLKQTESKFQNLIEFLEKLRMIKQSQKILKISYQLKLAQKNFQQALDKDFNTPKALGVLFKLISEIQRDLWKLNKTQAKQISKFIQERLKIFGIELNLTGVPELIKNLAKQREKFRKNRQWNEADKLRKKINKLGYQIEDTPAGPYIKPIT